jgi:hypothetical protein
LGFSAALRSAGPFLAAGADVDGGLAPVRGLGGVGWAFST